MSTTTSALSHLMDSVQTLPDLLTTYVISIVATYLTGVWGLSIVSVAVIINLYSGIVSIMPLGLKFIVDAFIGNYGNVLLSRYAFTAGFVLLTMSTPTLLSRATGTCSTDEPECIGQVQKLLFNVALPLIAVAVSCHKTSGLTYRLKSFLNEKSPSKGAGFYCEAVLGFVLMLFVPLVSLGAIGYTETWSVKFGIPAIFIVVSLILFLINSGSYQPQTRAEWSLLGATVFRKKDSRSILSLIPVSISFILLGVVSSLGNTFFIEQAVDMDHYVGSLWVPIIILPVFQHSYKKKRAISFGLNPNLGIAFSMVFAIVSCITAARMETRRLGVITSQDEHEETIPMTMFWLLPQFLLLGLSEAISDKSIADFFCNELVLEPNDVEATRESNRKYMEFLAQALSGVGIIFGLLLVYIVRDVTAANGGTSWFGNTVNTSRLDKYYWTLAAFSAGNLVLFGVVISSHRLCTKSRSVDDEQPYYSTIVPLIA
ncbi:hypothetical protein ACLB2K_056845 [Fragaria x ananassa]